MSVTHAGLQVLVGGRDITARISDLSYSSVDPGGYEACTITLEAAIPPPAKGATVAVVDGCSDVWWGRVEEPSPGGVTYTIAAVGAGAAAKDDPYSCIYVDRDLAGWRDISRQRRLELLTAGWNIGAVSQAQDSGGAPALSLTLPGPWGLAAAAEAFYDAGTRCKVAKAFLRWAARPGTGNASWTQQTWLQNADFDAANTEYRYQQSTLGAPQSGVYLPDGGTIAGVNKGLAAGGARFMRLAFLFGSSTGSTGEFGADFTDLAVYGDHGLPLRGPDPGGFYPSDIARHALQQVRGVRAGVIEDAVGYIVTQAAYREPTRPEKVWGDMAGLLGWHWGVWGPASVLDDTPRFHFRAPPPEATAACSRLHIDGFELADRLSEVYDRIIVSYRDAAGVTGYEEVSIDNPNMPDGLHRTADVDIGVASAASAQAFGRFWLLLNQRALRASGSGVLPSEVLAPNGSRRRALSLKAGRDRLRITDLPHPSANLLETDTRRFDTFRLKRVETTVAQGGAARTRAEFDGGADLVEVLQARLQAATSLAGG